MVVVRGRAWVPKQFNQRLLLRIAAQRSNPSRDASSLLITATEYQQLNHIGEMKG
jgi:hypothetical protein